VKRFRTKGETIGFVPTMGALHGGHLPLIRRARKECDRVIVSIFVNPLQFGPREDYRRYPRTFFSDVSLLQKEKVDILFFPSVKTMYPDLFSATVTVNGLSERLCGAFRPGHFQGVATACTKLFNLVQPDTVYFGGKDYQQTRIIDRLLNDFDFNIRLKVLPTVREKNGLAMSSRNRYLSSRERKKALLLSKALIAGGALIQGGEKSVLRVLSRMKSILKDPAVRVDYVSIVDPKTLEEVSRFRGKVLLAVAARIGKTRLIDNILVRGS